MEEALADKLLLIFREKDSPYGVSRETLKALSQELHITETMAVHMALARFAREVLPAYEADEGPLAAGEVARLKREARAHIPKGKPVRKRSLFPGR